MIILPGQFFSGRGTTPELRLMVAVLGDALGIVLKPSPRSRRGHGVRAETERWMFSDAAEWPFSFLNVCQALAIDPAWLRAQVLLRRSAAGRLQSAA
jgi:hypothetical protein